MLYLCGKACRRSPAARYADSAFSASALQNGAGYRLLFESNAAL
jgi:hypothetical protein